MSILLGLQPRPMSPVKPGDGSSTEDSGQFGSTSKTSLQPLSEHNSGEEEQKYPRYTYRINPSPDQVRAWSTLTHHVTRCHHIYITPSSQWDQSSYQVSWASIAVEKAYLWLPYPKQRTFDIIHHTDHSFTMLNNQISFLFLYHDSACTRYHASMCVMDQNKTLAIASYS